jgi:hypothetical protein
MLEHARDGEPGMARGTMELVALAIDAGERTSWVDRLARYGVNLESETEHTLYFRDPDGRRLALSSYPSRKHRRNYAEFLEWDNVRRGALGCLVSCIACRTFRWGASSDRRRLRRRRRRDG